MGRLNHQNKQKISPKIQEIHNRSFFNKKVTEKICRKIMTITRDNISNLILRVIKTIIKIKAIIIITITIKMM